MVDITSEVLAAIKRDFAFRRTKGEWLQEGKCPQCGKRELYAHAVEPKMIRCGRLNRCGWETHVRDHYPEIFDQWTRRAPPTETDPTATADAYLSHSRGLNLAGLRGAYSQEWYRDAERDIGSATVRFPIRSPAGEEISWWERLIDQPQRFDKKARFKYGASYKGHWWLPPDIDYAALAGADEIWLAEGIFDALALRQAGLTAVSLMSVNNWPEHGLKALRKVIADGETPDKSPELIFAFDVGAAGVEYTRKWVRQAKAAGWKACAAQVRPDGDGHKLDWNDLLLRDQLGEKQLKDYRWNGKVTIADSAIDKAALLYDKHEWRSFWLTFDRRTWWAAINLTQEAKLIEEGYSPDKAMREALTVDEIANCAFRILYRERDDAIDETNFYLSIDFPDAKGDAKGRFSSAGLTAAAEFKKGLFRYAGIWTGTTAQLDRMMRAQTIGLRTVQPIDFTGYSREHGAYVLGDLAVRNGRVFRVNAEDYFDFGSLAVKLRSPERLLDIEWDAEGGDTAWLEPLWVAYGVRGYVALAFWSMAFFAEQIRARHKSLAFLECVGIPGSGKTTLIEFLWKLAGRADYEGFDPTKATNAAIARQLGKVSNLPVVLIEGDRGDDTPHSRRFEWDELKTAYNGRAVRSRGVKSGGNETYDPPFRGAIVVSQNAPVSGSPAMLERIMGLTFDKSGRNEDTKAAAHALEQWPMDRISGFLVHAARLEEKWLEGFAERYAHHEKTLPARSGTTHQRIIKNHAQLAAAVDMLALLLPIKRERLTETHGQIDWMAKERAESIGADHPVVAKFWEMFDFLVSREAADHAHPLNCHRDHESLIAVNLSAFEQRARSSGLLPPSQDELKKHLGASRSRRFIGSKAVNPRGDYDRTLQCWIFQQPAARNSSTSRS